MNAMNDKIKQQDNFINEKHQLSMKCSQLLESDILKVNQLEIKLDHK